MAKGLGLVKNNLPKNQNSIMFVMRDKYLFNVIDPQQCWNQEPGRRKGESPQLFFGIAQSLSRTDLPFFNSNVMRDKHSYTSLSGKCSTGQSASSVRNTDPQQKLITDNFLIKEVYHA